MTTWIALFRGINVSGKNILPMTELRRELESFNLQDVRTYIQSGNAVFSAKTRLSKTLSTKIADRIEQRRGFIPYVLILSADQLANAIESNPFPQAEAEPKTLHLFFLSSVAAAADIESISARKSPSERYRLTDGVFYLHAPDGIGRSKLAANVEKLLGVTATARNWRTVQKLWEMVQAN